MQIRSITRRTVGIVLLAQIAFALALSSVMVWHEWHGRMHALDVQIAGHTDSLLGAIQDAEDPEDNVVLDPQELRLPPEDRYAVYSEAGRLVGRSAEGSPLAAQGPLGMSRAMVDGRAYRVLRRPGLRIIDRTENNGVGLRRPVMMVYATPMRHVLHETIGGVEFSLVSLALVALVTALLTTWLLRSTLRPIMDLALAAHEVSPHALQFTSPPSALAVQELRPLALTLSSLIDELREAFAKEQRFVGDAAHELKTAVAVVRSSVQVLMMRQRTAEDYAVGLERILEDNDRVEALVASMLELARFEQDETEDAPVLDLAEAARHACRTVQPMAEVKGVRLQVESAAATMVRLHPARAEAVLTNLLSNSIRHSVPCGVVTVAVQRQAAGATLEVADGGDGIRAEALPHVFERFYRDDPSRSRSSGGTGLGLAICRSIVEAAGGTIEIASTPGQGARVTCLFRNC